MPGAPRGYTAGLALVFLATAFAIADHGRESGLLILAIASAVAGMALIVHSDRNDTRKH